MAQIINTDGIVLKRTEAGDSGFYLKVLSPVYGTIDVTARGAKKQGAKNSAASQLLACSGMSLSVSKGRYYLESSEIINSFYNVRLDVVKLSLAAYFSQIILTVCTENQSAQDIYRLFTNSLYMLGKDDTDPEFIRFIFEMRIMGDIGFLPRLLGCAECYRTEPIMYFSPKSGIFLCPDHLGDKHGFIGLSASAMEAMRYVCLKDMEHLFSFRLSEKALRTLTQISEKYIILQLDREFDTLSYYKRILSDMYTVCPPDPSPQ
ncbi:MAG: DNA repair protein RecO [Oscillospiraceae bacterium]|nr:DNA repair protein RecO [Oscillospiraceae bacterium]